MSVVVQRFDDFLLRDDLPPAVHENAFVVMYTMYYCR